MIKGKIERLDRNGLIGWVAITDDAADKPQVEIIVDGEVVGRCRATRPRPDVEALGWGDGLCGVYIPIPDSVTDDQLEGARIRFVGTELYLETPAKPQPIAIPETREPKVSGHSPVFIVGSPRSGTSILVDALLAAGYSGFREGNLLGLVKPLFDCVDRYFKIHHRTDTRTLIGQLKPADFKDPIRRLFKDVLMRHNPTDPWFDKTGNPETIYIISDLVSLWPDCRILFAKRRGIENIVSRLRKFPENDFRFHCVDWARNMAAWRVVREAVARNRFIEIDQRNMIIEPDDVAADMSKLLGLDMDKSRAVAETFRHNRPQQTAAGTAERIVSIDESGWSPDQIAIFLKCCGGEMQEYGYSVDDAYWRPGLPNTKPVC